MSKEEVDINELIEFARKLDVFNTLIENDARMLITKWKELTWKDRERDRFDVMFEENMRRIFVYINESKEQVRFLHRKAEEYAKAHR